MEDGKESPTTPLLCNPSPQSLQLAHPLSFTQQQQLKKYQTELLAIDEKQLLMEQLKNDPHGNLPPISLSCCQKLLGLKITRETWHELESKITLVRAHTDLARKKAFKSKCFLIAGIASLGLPAIPLSRWATGHLASSDVVGRTVDASILPILIIVGGLLHFFLCPRVGCSDNKIIQKGQHDYIEALIMEMDDQLKFEGLVAQKIDWDLDYSRCPCS